MYFSTVDNKLRNFQLKLIHRCLPRRRILFISICVTAQFATSAKPNQTV